MKTKHLLLCATFVLASCFAKADVTNLQLVPANALDQNMKVDSGFFSSVQKGMRIASNLSLDNISDMATMILFSEEKNLGSISKNVGKYLNNLDTKRKELSNIKINKNTRVIIKRDK